MKTDMHEATDNRALQNRIILLTGAASQLGAAVARDCARHGATMILLDKNIKALEQLYDDIMAAAAPQPAIYPLDMKGASLTDYEELVTRIDTQFGQLDGLIHCAATLGQIAPVPHQDPVTWMETLHVNLTASYFLTRACLSLMQNNTRASIVFTTDSHKNKAYWSAYGISRAGLESLCLQLADEFEAEQRIHVNCIDPGMVDSELYHRAFPARDPALFTAPETVSPLYVQLMDLQRLTHHGAILKARDINCQTSDTH